VADGAVTQSMDDILAQIRKIIAEEPSYVSGTVARSLTPPPVSVPTPPVKPVQAEPQTALPQTALPQTAVPMAALPQPVAPTAPMLARVIEPALKPVTETAPALASKPPSEPAPAVSPTLVETPLPRAAAPVPPTPAPQPVEPRPIAREAAAVAPQADPVIPVALSDDLSDLLESDATSPPATVVAVAKPSASLAPVADAVTPNMAAVAPDVAPVQTTIVASPAPEPEPDALTADPLRALVEDHVSAPPTAATPPSNPVVAASILSTDLPRPQDTAAVATAAAVTTELPAPAVSPVDAVQAAPMPAALPAAPMPAAAPAPAVTLDASPETPARTVPVAPIPVAPIPAAPPAPKPIETAGPATAPVALSSLIANRVAPSAPASGLLLPTHIGRAVERPIERLVGPVPALVADAVPVSLDPIAAPIVPGSSALGALAAGLAATGLATPPLVEPAQPVSASPIMSPPVAAPSTVAAIPEPAVATVAPLAGPTPQARPERPSTDAIMTALEPILAQWLKTEMPDAVSAALRDALPSLIAKAEASARSAAATVPADVAG
jgi:hypothetical protein